MKDSLTIWLLAGALAASLYWNVAPLLRAPAQAPEAPSAAVDLGALGLSAEQCSTLASWSAESCPSACGLEQEAEAKLELLHRALLDPDETPQRLRALAAEAGRARSSSLEACVESVLEVRRVLTPEQLEKLLECCAPGGECSPRALENVR